MAEEAWRARLRERVVEAEGLFDTVLHVLTEREHLATPILAGDAAAKDARLKDVLRVLVDASSDLSFATSLMMGAELLAVRGASFNPLFPYHEIDQLGEDEYLAEMDAGAKLHGAVEAAQEACTCFDSICGHLHAMILLLDYPGLLDVIEEERVAAAADLSAAIERVRLGRSMAAGARQDVSAGGTD